jgi:hypothetical protein
MVKLLGSQKHKRLVGAAYTEHGDPLGHVVDRPLELPRTGIAHQQHTCRDAKTGAVQLTWELVRQDAGLSERRSDLRLVFDIQGLSPMHDLARVQRQLQLTSGRCSRAAAP